MAKGLCLLFFLLLRINDNYFKVVFLEVMHFEISILAILAIFIYQMKPELQICLLRADGSIYLYPLIS